MDTTSHPERIGKYEILSVIGQGGMGIVDKGRDPIIDRVVAIKTIHGDLDSSEMNLLERLRAEAKSAGRLHHPNIVTVFEFGQQDDLSYLVMEYVEGSNLARVINRGQPIPLDEKIDVIVQLCQGLDYAHSFGVTHRDIKPANICLTSKGVPKILDFGLARFDATKLTKTGFTSGTLSYMSPERMRGESGPSDDVFAIGAVAYEILTYQLAFPGGNYAEVVGRILSEDYPTRPSAVAELPPELDAILLKALARDTSKRYASAGDFAKALIALRNTSGWRAFVESQSGEPVVRVERVGDVGSGSHPYSAGMIDPSAFDPAHAASTPSDLTVSTNAFQPVLEPAAKPAVDPVDKTDLMAVMKGPVNPAAPPAADPLLFAPTIIDSVAPDFRKEEPGQTVIRPRVSREPGERRKPTLPQGDSPLTMLTRVMERFRHPRGEPAEKPPIDAVPAPVTTSNPALDRIPAIALVVALLAATLTARLGALALLIWYAVSIAAWHWLNRRSATRSLKTVLIAAAVLRIAMAIFAPAVSYDGYRALWDGEIAANGVNPYATAPSAPALALYRDATFDRIPERDLPSSHPPYAVMFFVIGSWIGGSMFTWRLLLAAADLVTVYWIFRAKGDRRAFAYATFPLILLEGIWLGRVEILTAALLVTALVAALRRREGSGAIAAGIASATSIIAIPALPAIFGTADRLVRTIVVTMMFLVLPFVLYATHGQFVAALRDQFLDPPLLNILHRGLAEKLERANLHKSIQDALGRFESESLTAFGSSLGPYVLSAVLVGVLLFVLLVIVTKRSRGPFSAIANCVGTILVISFVPAPAAWLVAVPFALAAGQSIWMMIAIFAPAAHLLSRTGSAADWLIYGLCWIVPLLAVVAMRSQKETKGDANPAFVAS